MRRERRSVGAEPRGRAQARWAGAAFALVLAALVGCASKEPLAITFGRIGLGPRGQVRCRLAPTYCEGTTLRYLEVTARSDCASLDDVSMAFTGPPESKTDWEAVVDERTGKGVRLPQGTPVTFRSPCFRKPDGEHASLVATLRTRCKDGDLYAMARCVMP